MDKKDRLDKAFDFASDVTKQLITLSTGIITVSITFSKDVFKSAPVTTLLISWILYLTAIIFGIGTLLALTGVLEPTSGMDTTPVSIRGRSVVFLSAIQIIAFVLATGFIIFAGWQAFSAGSST